MKHNTTYFADYKGGTVSIVEVNTGNYVYTEKIIQKLKKITIMERYDYLAAVKEDVLNYINENNIVVTSENRDEVEQDLNDTLFTCDSVTGNASGSYTFNAWTAEEYLCHNWDLLGEALTELGCDMSYIERGAEACDVTIRCYLLGQAISEVLDEVETEEEE